MSDLSRLYFPPGANSSVLVSKSQTLSANNTTATVAIFGLTGTVEILRLWGVVTTDLGANHTAAAYRINDQAAQVYLTAVGGTTLSAIKAGSVIAKTGLVATAVTKVDNVAGAIQEPATTQTSVFTPVVIVKKTAATTNIEYKYTTTDTPTTGVIQHFVEYIPRSSDGALTAL